MPSSHNYFVCSVVNGNGKMKSLACAFWGSPLILPFPSFGELNEVELAWIANSKRAQRWDLPWQWTRCSWLGRHYLCWSLASCGSSEAIPLPPLLTPPVCCIWFLILYVLPPEFYTLPPFSPESSGGGLVSTLQTHCASLSTGPLPPVSPHTLSVPPRTIPVSFLQSKPDQVPSGVEIPQWLLNVNKIKKLKILSRDYQTHSYLALGFLPTRYITFPLYWNHVSSPVHEVTLWMWFSAWNTVVFNDPMGSLMLSMHLFSLSPRHRVLTEYMGYCSTYNLHVELCEGKSQVLASLAPRVMSQ